MNIFDVHSHILPGLDDGASTERQALLMLKEARRQGIREIIATPHYSVFYKSDDADLIRGKCRRIEKIAAVHNIGVRVYPGQEIMYSERIPDMLAEGKLLTLAGSRYVLLEFYPGAPRSLITHAVREVAGRGFRPVLAHAERYTALRDADHFADLTAQGAYIQMNFRPAGGKWYDAATRRCRKLLKDGSVHFLGTDMHNMSSRRPETKEALGWMQRHLEREYIRDLIRGNAEKILSDQKI